MPSKRCAMSAKRSGNCSSAAVTNRMAWQSRCEIRVQASRRRLSSTFSTPSTRRSLAVWGWACRSAVRSSKRTAADCGRARTCPAAPAFNSPCPRSQTLRRDAALVSRPKEQATRPRVLLWVESRCGAVALGRTYLLPPLSSGGALVVPPWLRFHIPLIEPDRQISRIRLSDKTSRCRVQCPRSARRRDHAFGSCDRLPFARELDALRIVRSAGGGDDGLHVALGAGDDVEADPLR